MDLNRRDTQSAGHHEANSVHQLRSSDRSTSAFKKFEVLAKRRPLVARASHFREILIQLMVLTAACGFYVMTIRRGHIWGDDFAMYILQARNFASGFPVEQTGYIYNPAFPDVGPPAYPPLFPFMLSLVCRFVGFDLTAMKIEVILCFMASLFVACRIFRRYTTFSSTLLILLVLALNPYFLALKDNIGADLPFLLLCYVTLYLTDVCDRRAWNDWLYNGLLAVALYLSYATRTVAIVLIPAVMAFAIIRMRKVPVRALGVTAGAAVLIVAHMLVFPAVTSYAGQVSQLTVPRIVHNATAYYWDIQHVLWSVGSFLPGLLLSCALIALGAAGYLIRFSGHISILEVFGPVYILTIMCWASDVDLRFFIPVIPLWVLYITVALRRLWLSQSVRVMGKTFAAVTVLGVGLGYANGYMQANWGPIQEGIGDPQFRQLCDYIRSSTAPSSVFVFRKPRLLALATDRKAAASAPSAKQSQVSILVDNIHANYIVLAPQFDDYAALRGFVRMNQSRVRNVFSNSGFQLFALQKPGGEAGP